MGSMQRDNVKTDECDEMRLRKVKFYENTEKDNLPKEIV